MGTSAMFAQLALMASLCLASCQAVQVRTATSAELASAIRAGESDIILVDSLTGLPPEQPVSDKQQQRYHAFPQVCSTFWAYLASYFSSELKVADPSRGPAKPCGDWTLTLSPQAYTYENIVAGAGSPPIISESLETLMSTLHSLFVPALRLRPVASSPASRLDSSTGAVQQLSGTLISVVSISVLLSSDTVVRHDAS